MPTETCSGPRLVLAINDRARPPCTFGSDRNVLSVYTSASPRGIFLSSLCAVNSPWVLEFSMTTCSNMSLVTSPKSGTPDALTNHSRHRYGVHGSRKRGAARRYPASNSSNVAGRARPTVQVWHVRQETNRVDSTAFRRSRWPVGILPLSLGKSDRKASWAHWIQNWPLLTRDLITAVLCIISIMAAT